MLTINVESTQHINLFDALMRRDCSKTWRGAQHFRPNANYEKSTRIIIIIIIINEQQICFSLFFL